MSDTADRWTKIENAYHGARCRRGDERSRFLDETCGSDALMRWQVDALLEQDDQSHSLLDGPSVARVPGRLPPADGRLKTGSRIGAYEILEPIGSGGMADVYRARDTKLNRDVALKLLPGLFALDSERLARFKREAQVLASLNHPNIAAIYGFEESHGVQALVLELVEGPTLADRIAQAPLFLEEAVRIARQMADALEAAHARGIVHRDLKPSNVKIRPDGTVKVLDFGLAKALQLTEISSGATVLPESGATVSEVGVILGTAAYMSPEQARGEPVDRRVDIWAFGVVFYEMLSGHRLFGGATTSDTLASVLKDEPDWSRVPEEAASLLRRCLAKDRKHRLRDIGDAMPLVRLTDTPASKKKRRRSAAVAWASFALLAALTITLWTLHFQETATAADPIRFQVPLPEGIAQAEFVSFALSPDGRQIAFWQAAYGGSGSIWVRKLDSLEVRELKGSESLGAGRPLFWTADSRFIVFDAGGTLKKLDTIGGPAQTLCEVRQSAGGSANRDGVIIFGTTNGTIMRTSQRGAEPSAVTTLESERGEIGHRFPSFLPDGRHFLYVRVSTIPEKSGLYLGSLDNNPVDQSATPLLTTSSGAIFVPSNASGPGHLLFVRDGALIAQPFDPRTLKIVGDPHPIVDHVGTLLDWGSFSASATGVLVYRAGITPKYQLTWLDERGKILSPVGEPAIYNGLAISPDGEHAAIVRRMGDEMNIWLMALPGGTTTRLTSGRFDGGPVWSPDGSRLAFASLRNGTASLYIKNVNGTTEEPLLPDWSETAIPLDWSHDGRFLLYATRSPNTKYDVWVLPFGADRTPEPLLHSEFNEIAAALSPDGRWIAYHSDESGRGEIYVRQVSSSQGSLVLEGGIWRVSNGALESVPAWRSDGKALGYMSLDNRVMIVPVIPKRSFPFGEPKPSFAVPPGVIAATPTPDLQRTLAALPLAETASSFTVVLNWPVLVRN